MLGLLANEVQMTWAFLNRVVFSHGRGGHNNNDRTDYFTPCACTWGKYPTAVSMIQIIVIVQQCLHNV